MINAGLRSYVFKSIVHPSFDSETFSNNIALLILESQLNFSNRIFPICFPTEKITLEENGSLVGFKSKGFASELSEVDLPIAKSHECEENGLNVNEKSFCVGRKSENNICRSCLGKSRVCLA